MDSQRSPVLWIFDFIFIPVVHSSLSELLFKLSIKMQVTAPLGVGSLFSSSLREP